jgi:hypothetical protein
MISRVAQASSVAIRRYDLSPEGMARFVWAHMLSNRPLIIQFAA